MLKFIKNRKSLKTSKISSFLGENNKLILKNFRNFNK